VNGITLDIQVHALGYLMLSHPIHIYSRKIIPIPIPVLMLMNYSVWKVWEGGNGWSESRSRTSSSHWYLRMLLGISWYHFVSNDELECRTNQPVQS